MIPKLQRARERLQNRLPNLQNPWIGCAVALTPAFLLRVLLMLGQPPFLWPDSLTYLRWAESISAGVGAHSYPLYRTPLYSLFLSSFPGLATNPGMITAAIACQHLLGLLAVGAVYAIARLLFGPLVGCASAMLFGVHGLQLYYEHTVLTEALFLPLLWASIAMVVLSLRSQDLGRNLLLGGILGLTSLTRPVGQPLIILAVMLLLFRHRKFGMSVVVPLTAFFLTVLPWMAVNREHHGHWGLSRELGINLFHRVVDVDRMEIPPDPRFEPVRSLVESARKKRSVVYFDVWNRLKRRGYSSLEADHLLLDAAVGTIRADPMSYLVSSIAMFEKYFFYQQSSLHPCLFGNIPTYCSENRTQHVPSIDSSYQRVSAEVAGYGVAAIRMLNLPIPIFAALALFLPITASLRRTRRMPALAAVWKRDPHLLIHGYLTSIILLFGSLIALFNNSEDRMRLPVDGLIIVYGCAAAAMLLRATVYSRSCAVERSVSTADSQGRTQAPHACSVHSPLHPR